MQNPFSQERGAGFGASGEGRRTCAALDLQMGSVTAMSVLREGQAGLGRQACWLPLDRIVPNPRQPRKSFDDYALMELASSIRQHGLLQPITVRAAGGGYEIVMGERRYRARLMLGFTHIDAFILPTGEEESALLALIENLQRQDLHYFEEAEAFAGLIAGGISQETLARRLGKSPSGIANKLRLLKLDGDLRQYLMEAGLSERHARALLALSDPAARGRVARQAAESHLTVRETEALVRKTQKRLPTPPTRKVISLVHDPRLYVNAIKNVMRQMQETGLDAAMETQDGDSWLEMRIRIRKYP